MNKQLVAVITAALASPIAIAQDAPSYTFAEIGYTNIDLDDGFDADGFKIKGSAGLGEYVFITGELAQTSGDIVGIDFDIDTTSFGIGGKYDLDNGGSVFASYTFGSWDVEGTDLDIDTLRIGYRHMVSEALELNGSLTSNDAEDETETGYQLGLAFAVNETVQITADYETIDNIDLLSVGARFSF